MPEHISYSQLYAIRAARVTFADYVQRKELINEGRLKGSSLNPTYYDSSVVVAINEAEVYTTPSEVDTYLAEIALPGTSTTVRATVPNPPTSLCIIPCPECVSVFFIPGSDGGSPITNYQYSLNGGITYTNINLAPTTLPSVMILNLTNGVEYTVYLKAVNAVGASVASTSVTAAPIPGTFYPSYITGLNVWLDGQNIDSVILMGDHVSAWNDTLNVNNFTKGGSGMIMYHLPSNINNRPAVNFMSTDAYLSKSFNMSPSNNQLVLFMIVNQTSTGTGNSELFFTRNDFKYFDLFSNTNPGQTGRLSLNVRNDTQRDTGIDIITTNPSTIALISVVINTTTASVYVNGTITSVNNTSSTGLSLNNTLEWAVSGGAFIGDIGEVITYNTVISNLDRQKIEGYLAWKWGLQNNLPVGHPYKASPPTS